jgi:hypothetical protein
MVEALNVLCLDVSKSCLFPMTDPLTFREECPNKFLEHTIDAAIYARSRILRGKRQQQGQLVQGSRSNPIRRHWAGWWLGRCPWLRSPAFAIAVDVVACSEKAEEAKELE